MAVSWCKFSAAQWAAFSAAQWAAFGVCSSATGVTFFDELLGAYTPGAESGDVWTGVEGGGGYCGPDNAGSFLPSVAGAYNG